MDYNLATLVIVVVVVSRRYSQWKKARESLTNQMRLVEEEQAILQTYDNNSTVSKCPKNNRHSARCVEACKNLTTSLFLTYSLEVRCLTKIRGQLPRSQLRAPWGTPYCGLYREAPLERVSFFCACSTLKGREIFPFSYVKGLLKYTLN